MFRDAVFRIGNLEFTLPVRLYEIRRIELDYGCRFIRWAEETETIPQGAIQCPSQLPLHY